MAVQYFRTLLHGYGLVALGLALVGVVVAWRFRPAHLSLLLAFPVVSLTLLLSMDLFFPRLVLPLLPFLSILSAYGVAGLTTRLSGRWRLAVIVVLLTLGCAQPLANDLLHARLLATTNTRVEATTWIANNLPPGSAVLGEFRSVLDRSADGRPYPPELAGFSVVVSDRPLTSDDPSFYRRAGYDYLVTSSYAYERLLGAGATSGQRAVGDRYLRLHTRLEQDARLMARFAPGRDGLSVDYSQDEIFTPFWNLDRYERPGPTIHIYALD